ncbi:SGNH/GDSL hydrolase family protein [Sphingomonas sp. CCH5-D11]|uniref:SGNH/GDSL hydrolase family protein n=1 Tax=Sphingomonas sp. CCH5-D11 TaxID=1768786 RepID=UPI00082A783C|nr:SGNH/GDSL hydrolase family protein [Sphingomonas sp. CCH5-D11]
MNVTSRRRTRSKKSNGRWFYLAGALLLIIVTLLAFRAYSSAQPQRDLVVFVGDSITEGVASTDPTTTSRPGLYQSHVGNDVIVANDGVNGITLGSLAGQVSSVERYFRSGRNNVAIIHGGSNDFALGSKAAPLFKTLQEYAGRLHDGGWKVAVGTVMRRNGLPPEQERERQAFNALLRNGTLQANGIAVLDFDAEERAGKVEIADGVHPSDAGYAAMSKLDVAFADKALGR